MQMQGFSAEHKVYKSTWECTKEVFKMDGILGFYRGLIPNYLKVVPAISISFVVYERIKQMLGG
jgi:solute carrier family 25 phosphate transporter 23/24/25/41